MLSSRALHDFAGLVRRFARSLRHILNHEIRELADHSRNAVDQIRKVTEDVVHSVAFLSDSAEKLLTFMNEKSFSKKIHFKEVKNLATGSHLARCSRE